MDENICMLWLSRSLLFNTRKIYHILSYFGTPGEVYNADENLIKSIGNVNETDIKRLEEGKEEITAWIDENKKAGVEFISLLDKRYPSLLKEIYEPPAGIYVKGKLPCDDDTCIGVIGARRCSEYGSRMAYKFSKEMAAKGFTVVSGMARGIDGMSHKGALDAGGKTIAILGFGHNFCYPSENRGLMEKIAENGCLISEYSPDTEPQGFMFIQRNRIIAGISKGLIVVEAAKKSGTLSTVDFALENGRTVMTLPANITSRTSEGTNELIKQGCPIITDIDDICFEFGKIEKMEEVKEAIKDNESIGDEEKHVLLCIKDEPVSTEYIKNKTGMKLQDVQYILTMLEISGNIEKLPGDRYIKAV